MCYEMTEESDKLIRPIRNASAPGTLAALCLAALRIGGDFPYALKLGLLTGAIMFLLSAFFMFFYSIYPTRKTLWTGTAVTFLFGLLSLVSSAVVLLFIV
jgi:hypothetical protein